MHWEPRIDVTNGDILAAKSDWLAAQDGDAPQSRVDELGRGYIQLVRAQAPQIAEAFRAENTE